MRSLGDDLFAVSQFGFERELAGACNFACQEAVHVERGITAHRVFGLSEDVIDVSGWNDPKSNFSIETAEGHVVDLIAKGWNIRALGGVNLHDQNILGVLVQMLGQFKRKGSEPAPVVTEMNAVDPDR